MPNLPAESGEHCQSSHLQVASSDRTRIELSAIRIASIFLVFALTWIVTSDMALELFARDHVRFVAMQTYKGSAFVAVTALLIYLLVRRQMTTLLKANVRELHNATILREAHAQQQLAYSAAELGSWHYNGVEGTIHSDERAALHFGIGKSTGLERFLSGLHPDDQTCARAFLQAAQNGERRPLNEYRFRQVDGSYRWIAVTLRQGEFDATEPIARVVGTSQDITSRKASEEALRASEALMRTATDSTGVGIVVLDNDRRYTFANPAYLSVLGISGDIIGKTVEEVMKSAYDGQIRPRLDRAFHGERVTYELNGPFDRSKFYSVVYDPRWDGSGQVSGVTVIIFETTELRRSEEALRNTERELNRAQAVSHTGSWRKNQITKECHWSDETYRISKVPIGTEVTRAMLVDPIHPDDREFVRNSWREAMRGKAFDIEHRIIVDHQVKWVHQRAEVEWSADNQPLMVFGTIQDITVAKDAADALSSSEARFRGIYERALAGIMIVGWDGIVESANPAICSILGYSEHELCGRHFADLIHQEDRKISIERGEQLRAGKFSYFISESRYLHKNGQPVWMRKIVSTLPNDNGASAKIFALSIDVSESRRSALALQASEQRLKHVLAATGEGIWDWSVESDLVQHNTQWCRILGLDDTFLEHSVQAFINLIHEEDRGAVNEAITACINDRKPYFSEHRIRRADDDFIWVQDRGNVVERDEYGVALRMVGSMIDVTARKVAEREQARLFDELRRSEIEAREQKALQQSIFDCTPDGMVLTDLNRKIININPAFTDVFGYQLTDLLGQPSRILYATDADCDIVGAHIVAGKNGSIAKPLNCMRKSGAVFPAHMTGSKLLGSDGQIIGFLGVYRDITIELKREQSLREKQRLEALGRLTGGVAHDFNNLLTVISGNIQLVEMTVVDKGLKLHLAEAERAIEMGARLNQRLMTFAKQRRLEPVALNLNDLVRSILDLIRRSIGETINVSTALVADPANVLIDPSEMENAILNLALNARDAMSDGGSIHLETSNFIVDAESSILHGGLPSGPFVRLSVSDSGSGMSGEVMSRAFEPFFTTKDEGQGTGLGLTTLHGFVRQSGGHVSLYSELGHGTTVTVLLPSLFAETPAPFAENLKAPPVRGCGETILVVEDNSAVRAVTCARLRTLGYAVLEAENGMAALAIISINNTIDLVFSDIIMPGGMTGFDLAKRVRGNNPKLKLLLTSGFPDDIARTEAQSDERLPILRKPYSQQELARFVANALAK